MLIYCCPLCTSDRQEIIYAATVDASSPLTPADFDCTNAGHGQHYQIVRCVDCGMKYCSPRPTPQEIATVYQESEDSAYIEGEEGRRQTFRRALTHVGGFGGRLLDIGCNTGVFLEEARQCGYQVFGVEPSHYAASRARDIKKLAVHCGLVPGELPWPDLFQVVTLWDVIEHVDQPRELVQFIFDRLHSGGEFHLSTMNVEALFPRLAGQRWPWYMRMHIQYFSKRSIRQLLEGVGFSNVRIESYCHVIHKQYLFKKLTHLAAPLRVIGNVGAFLLANRQGFIPVSMGDMMHVIAYKS